jgi:DNA-binding MarR family transcriptional regulator
VARAKKVKVNFVAPLPLAVDYGALESSVGFLLRLAQLSVFGSLIEVLAPVELRPAQFSALALIDANPDLPQSNLSAVLGIHRANFVAMLDELEARGFTARCVSRQDRRIKTLALTAEGRRVLARAVALHAAHEARLLKRLGSGGRRELEGLLKQLIAPLPD